MSSTKELFIVVFGQQKFGNYRVESIHADRVAADRAVAEHPHTHSQITRICDRPRVIPINPGILAWDISDAFAKDDDSPFDFGMDEIEAALPAIIEAILARVK